MSITDSKTKLFIETVSSGFLGLPVLYYLWQGNVMIAYSKDKINWKMGTWFEQAKNDKKGLTAL
jgi:hypothetical protein